MEIKRGSSKLFDLEDSNPVDSVKSPFVFEDCTAKDIKFWRLQDFIAIEDEKRTGSSSYFTLQNETWRFFSHVTYCDRDLFAVENAISIRIHTYLNDVALDKFDVRIGILTKSGEELKWTYAKASNDILSTSVPLNRLDPESLEKWSMEQFLYIEIKRNEGEKRPIFPINMLHDFTSLFLSGRYSDFTIKVKETAFKVHRSILGARSPIFFEMTRREWPRKENCKKEVSIKDVEPAIFNEFLLYLYSGREEHLNWKNISEFYKLGNTYSVQDLTELCIEYWKNNLCKENFFDIFLISQESNDLDLWDAVIQFFQENKEEIVSSKKCLDFLTVHPEKTCVLSILIHSTN